jgi:hypothetical protein
MATGMVGGKDEFAVVEGLVVSVYSVSEGQRLATRFFGRSYIRVRSMRPLFWGCGRLASMIHAADRWAPQVARSDTSQLQPAGWWEIYLGRKPVCLIPLIACYMWSIACCMARTMPGQLYDTRNCLAIRVSAVERGC